MIEAQLTAICPDIEISELKMNSTYNFKVKVARASRLRYTVVFTDGLSYKPQIVPEKHAEFEKIELYFCLPDYWNLERNPWPIEWINRLGEVPQKFSTWYGVGDTIPAGKPPKPITTNPFKANHFMLSDPISATIFNPDYWANMGIRFLGIVPISQNEFDYKIRNSATVLMKRLVNKNYTEQVDLFRAPVCRKRILGFF